MIHSKLIETIAMLNDERVERLNRLASTILTGQFEELKNKGICPAMELMERRPELAYSLGILSRSKRSQSLEGGQNHETVAE